MFFIVLKLYLCIISSYLQKIDNSYVIIQNIGQLQQAILKNI